MATQIFICYRRDDSAGYTGRIEDRIRRDLGDILFVDVAPDAVPLGVNFVKVLHEEVAKCAVLLAVIGSRWLSAKGKNKKRRLDDPNDFVRVEIGAALQRDIPVIPILLEGVEIPRADQLPDDLKELAVRNALDVRHASFHSDMDKLIRELKRLAEPIKQEAETQRQAEEERGRRAQRLHQGMIPSMAPGASKQKPLVFLSFAIEDVEWKRALMEPSWWAALTKIADILDYDDSLDLSNVDWVAVGRASAVIVILSKYYIQKPGLIELEFGRAVERLSASNKRNFFCPIVIDPEAKQWWDGRQHKIFEENKWLQNKIYWELIEHNHPANFNGDMRPQYAAAVRDYAWKLAASILPSQTPKQS